MSVLSQREKILYGIPHSFASLNLNFFSRPEKLMYHAYIYLHKYLL